MLLFKYTTYFPAALNMSLRFLAPRIPLQPYISPVSVSFILSAPAPLDQRKLSKYAGSFFLALVHCALNAF